MSSDFEIEIYMSNMDKGDRGKFTVPMSKSARKLLNDLLKHSLHFAKGNIKLAADTLAANFDPILYEEAAHLYDIGHYLKLLPKKIKNVNEFKNLVLLSNLKDQAWLRANELHYRTNRVGLISNAKAVEVYRWITTEFLLIDFTDQDLNKIAFMGQESFDLAVIKAEAKKIQEIDKRNVSYLYAIVRDKALKLEAHKTKEFVKEEEERSKLAGILSSYLLVDKKLPYQSTPEDLERRRRHLEYLKVDIDHDDDN